MLTALQLPPSHQGQTLEVQHGSSLSFARTNGVLTGRVAHWGLFVHTEGLLCSKWSRGILLLKVMGCGVTAPCGVWARERMSDVLSCLCGGAEVGPAKSGGACLSVGWPAFHIYVCEEAGFSELF